MQLKAESESIRVSRPTVPTGGGPQQSHYSVRPSGAPRMPFRKAHKKLVWLGIALLLVAIVLYIAWLQVSSQIMGNRYQAVFLNNGQVYFGKLHGYYGSRPYMTDVYYFQANSQSAPTSPQQAGGNQLLVKLGQEIHAPENTLILNKSSILFVENLTDSGKVVQAIIKNDATQQSAGITR